MVEAAANASSPVNSVASHNSKQSQQPPPASSQVDGREDGEATARNSPRPSSNAGGRESPAADDNDRDRERDRTRGDRSVDGGSRDGRDSRDSGRDRDRAREEEEQQVHDGNATIFIHGLDPYVRARDLAHIFEKYPI